MSHRPPPKGSEKKMFDVTHGTYTDGKTGGVCCAMRRILMAASGVDAPATETTDVPSKAFWTAYDEKTRECRSDPAQRMRLRTNLSDTVRRLCAKGTSLDVTETSCTFWTDDTTLWFVPTRIDVDRICEEQAASLAIMHRRATCGAPIAVVVDLRDLTLAFCWSTLFRATRMQVVDGMRLWPTLPHKISTVRILPSKKSAVVSSVCATVVRHVLSAKVRERTEFTGMPSSDEPT
jgi:hypothetical protein